MASKPSIAILDDYFDIAPSYFSHLVPDHLSAVDSFPTTINAQKDPEALISRLKPYTMVSSMRERTAFPQSVLAELPNLKLLLTTGMRNASIDVQACEDHGITLTGTRGSKVKVKAEGYDNTSEHCWALILALAKGVARDDKIVKEVRGGWESRPSLSLAGKTLGLLGLGKLGAHVARTGVLGFGMKPIAWSTNLTQEKADAQALTNGLPAGTITAVPSKADLFRLSDVLSIHYVLSPRSHSLVTSSDIALMRPSALLINTSRGALIDEQALLAHLQTGTIRGAALDVFADDDEPLVADSKWRTTEWGTGGRSEVVLTPHMGYVEEQVLRSWYEEQAENVQRWLEGGEEAVVDKIKVTT